MAEKKQNRDISKLTFEQAIHQLTAIVNKIEQGQIPLQQSIEQYERGMALIKHCRSILQQAEKRLEIIAASDQQPQNNDQTAEDPDLSDSDQLF